MRLLRITTSSGTFDADIDNDTAIGITLQAYDIKQPGKRKINITNQFTIPITANNMLIFGFPGSIHSTSKKVYKKNSCDYWVDNVQLITNAGIRVEEISDRISCFIFQKASIWDELKLMKWPEFQRQYVKWLQDTKGLETFDNPFIGTLPTALEVWNEFINYYNKSDNEHYLFIPLYYGNLLHYPNPYIAEDLYLEYLKLGYMPFITISHFNYKEMPYIDSKAGHFCTHVKHIFEFIESYFDVNFFTSGGEFPGNVWDDSYAKSLFTPIRDVEVLAKQLVYPINFFYFYIDEEIEEVKRKYSPLDIINDKADKTLYDFVNAFFQHFNIIIDETDQGIKLYRWDDIETFATVKDWSGISGEPSFKPAIENFKQNNYINFKEIYPDGDKTQYRRNIICGNENLDFEDNLFEIDSYVNAVIKSSTDIYISDLSVSESFKTFQFFVPDGIYEEDCHCVFRYYPSTGNPTIYTAPCGLIIAAQYSLESEYQLLEKALETPKYYEIEKWLRLKDVINLKFFCLYYFKELGGSFFLNKISGFNPQKSNEPTKLELFKVSDKTPDPEYLLDYFTDGIGDPFTDGVGDYFY